MNAGVRIGDVKRQLAVVKEQIPAARGHLLVDCGQGILSEANRYALDQRHAYANRGMQLSD